MDVLGLILLGLVVAAGVAVSLLARRLVLANVLVTDLRLETARLSERLNATAAEASRLQTRADSAERNLEASHRDASEARARLEERAHALADIEKRAAAMDQENRALVVQLGEARESQARAASAAESADHRVIRLEQELRASADQLSKFADQNTALSAGVSELRAQLESERSNAGEKLALLSQAKDELTNQFKLLAGDILEEKRKSFTEHSQTALASLLKPFGASIDAFKKRVEEVHTNESQQRAALSQELKTTFTHAQHLAKGTEELTRALKGSAKVQGNWGERVLETVLEASGLRQGHEYAAQFSSRREDGTRGQPDVVINLPGGRHLVVDSKVSLTAFHEHVNAETDVVREAALKRHIESVRMHVKGLSAKNYQNLYEVRTLDFVLMFVPIEPAVMVAATSDPSIFQDALDKNIILVSPSTLLFVLRTVASLWKQEQQSTNAQEIARQGGELYDKLVGFVAELDKVGASIGSAQASFTEARAKLASGRGNLIRRAEQLKSIGAKATKALPTALIERAAEGDEPPLGLISDNSSSHPEVLAAQASEGRQRRHQQVSS